MTRVRYSSCSANLISEMARGERGSCRVAGSRRAMVTSSSTTIPSTAHRSSSLAGCRGIGELSSGGRQPESSHPRNCRGIIINYGRAAPAPTVCIAAQNMQVMFDNVGWMESTLRVDTYHGFYNLYVRITKTPLILCKHMYLLTDCLVVRTLFTNKQAMWLE